MIRNRHTLAITQDFATAKETHEAQTHGTRRSGPVAENVAKPKHLACRHEV